MTTITPTNFLQMTTATDRVNWFTVISRHTLQGLMHEGSRIAFETKKEAIAHARRLGWADYTWAPDGR